MSLENMNDILTVKDVHDYLGIGYNMVYSLLQSGAITNFKIGRARKIPKKCLEDFVNGQIENCVIHKTKEAKETYP